MLRAVTRRVQGTAQTSCCYQGWHAPLEPEHYCLRPEHRTANMVARISAALKATSPCHPPSRYCRPHAHPVVPHPPKPCTHSEPNAPTPETHKGTWLVKSTGAPMSPPCA